MMLRTPPANRKPCLPSPSNLPQEEEEEEEEKKGQKDDGSHYFRPLQPVKSEILPVQPEEQKIITDISPQVQALHGSVSAAEKGGLVEQIKVLEHKEAAVSACEKAIQDIKEIEPAEEMYRLQFKRCEDLEVKLQQEIRRRSEAEMKLDAAANKIVSIEYELNKSKEESKKHIIWLEECISKLQKDIQQDASKTRLEKGADNSGVQITEAEVRAIQSQCEHLQQCLSECLEENCNLSRKLAAAAACQVTSSHSQDMQLEIKNLKDQINSFEAVVEEARKAKQMYTSVKLLEKKLENERLRAERAEAALVKSQNQSLNDLEVQNQRLKRKVELLTKERDGLQAILSSYNEEDVILSSRNKTDIGICTLGRAEEKQIQEMKTLIEDLQREGDALRLDLSKAATKLGRGDYDPFSTRVVHMVENLDFNAEKQVLLAEIQSLREKVRSVEDIRLNEGIECSKSTEMSLLSKQVDSLEKREARYKKVFAEKISLFRQACCLLFGYMVEMSEEQQVSTGMTVTLFTLQSIYAQNEDETMEFLLESNRMNLRANKYVSSQEISRMVDVYCKKFKSIPAFTANLTSELFNRSTLN